MYYVLILKLFLAGFVAVAFTECRNTICEETNEGFILRWSASTLRGIQTYRFLPNGPLAAYEESWWDIEDSSKPATHSFEVEYDKQSRVRIIRIDRQERISSVFYSASGHIESIRIAIYGGEKCKLPGWSCSTSNYLVTRYYFKAAISDEALAVDEVSGESKKARIHSPPGGHFDAICWLNARYAQGQCPSENKLGFGKPKAFEGNAMEGFRYAPGSRCADISPELDRQAYR